MGENVVKKLLALWKKYSFLALLAFVILGLVDFRIAIAAVVCMVAPVIVSFLKVDFGAATCVQEDDFSDQEDEANEKAS